MIQRFEERPEARLGFRRQSLGQRIEADFSASREITCAIALEPHEPVVHQLHHAVARCNADDGRNVEQNRARRAGWCNFFVLKFSLTLRFLSACRRRPRRP
jgi:hypothetical protein